MIRECVQAIIPLPNNTQEPFFIEAAQIVVAGLLNYYCDEGYDFIDAAQLIQGIPLASHIQKIRSVDNELAELLLAQFSAFKNPEESKMILSIATTITNRLIAFAADPIVRAALAPSKDTVRWEDLETHNILIRVDQSKLEQWGPVITMMLTQLIRTLERRPNKHTPRGENLEPVLVLLDEFARIGKMEFIAEAMSTLRIKKVTVALILQSLSQLDLHYGEHRRKTIIDNCSYIAVISESDPDTQRYFSDMVGLHKVKRTSTAKSTDESGKVTGYSTTAYEEFEPIVRPEEFRNSNYVKLITPHGFYRIMKAPYYEEPRKGIFSRIAGFFCKIGRKVKSFFCKDE